MQRDFVESDPPLGLAGREQKEAVLTSEGCLAGRLDRWMCGCGRRNEFVMSREPFRVRNTNSVRINKIRLGSLFPVRSVECQLHQSLLHPPSVPLARLPRSSSELVVIIVIGIGVLSFLRDGSAVEIQRLSPFLYSSFFFNSDDFPS